MTMGGSFSDSLGQTGNWSGVLREQPVVTVDATGNGTGYESFDGSIGATVTNPDGSTKSIPAEALDFVVPVFTIQNGHFSISQSGTVGFEGLGLSVKVDGTLNTTQPTASVSLNIPFNGLYDAVNFNGSISGSSSLSTPPMTLTGEEANQSTYAATKLTPFGTIDLTDLNGIAVTAKVTMSQPTHGTFINLGGGKYDRATGVYTITGGASAVTQALSGLAFDPAGNLGSPGHPVTTGFTISVSDADGASASDSSTSVVATQPLSIKGVSGRRTTTGTKPIAPFYYVAIGDTLGAERDTVRITLSNPANGTLSNLGGGFYSKKNGVYVFGGTAAAATAALKGLEFTPSDGARPTVTGFTIQVRNAAGAIVLNTGSKVTANAAAAGQAHVGVALFTQYAAAGLHTEPNHAAEITTTRIVPALSHIDFAGGHR